MKPPALRARHELLSLTAASSVAPWRERRGAIAALMGLNSSHAIDARISAIDYCQHALPRAAQTSDIGPIWQFWAQGLDTAPPIVSSCIASVAANTAGRQHIVLTAKTMRDYVDVPRAMAARLDFWGWTKFSNLLRLLLLEKYGGTWVDATVLLTAPIPQFISQSDFFVFRWNYDPRILANWFIHAVRAHPLISACRAAYQKYWMTATVPGDYFMFHFIFEALILSSRDLQAAWQCVPYYDAAIPHELQAVLDHPYSAHGMQEISARSPIQKLSYKTNPPPRAERTFRQHITSMRPPSSQ